MRDTENYYGYGGYGSDYDNGVPYLLDAPSWRPIGDIVVWLKHTLLLIGGRLPQWILAILLMLVSTAVMAWGSFFAMAALDIQTAAAQHKWWAYVLSFAVLLFVQMLPLLFAAGFVSIAAGVSEERSFVFGRLFSGFGERKWTLVRLYLFWFLAATAYLMAMANLKNPVESRIFWALFGIFPLFFLCNWMSLPLIMLQGVPAAKAMWMSLTGSLKNIVQLSVFLLITLVLGYGAVTLLLFKTAKMTVEHNNLIFAAGLLLFYAVVFPLLPVISYVSYRNIWTTSPLK